MISRPKLSLTLAGVLMLTGCSPLQLPDRPVEYDLSSENLTVEINPEELNRKTGFNFDQDQVVNGFIMEFNNRMGVNHNRMSGVFYGKEIAYKLYQMPEYYLYQTFPLDRKELGSGRIELHINKSILDYSNLNQFGTEKRLAQLDSAAERMSRALSEEFDKVDRYVLTTTFNHTIVSHLSPKELEETLSRSFNAELTSNWFNFTNAKYPYGGYLELHEEGGLIDHSAKLLIAFDKADSVNSGSQIELSVLLQGRFSSDVTKTELNKPTIIRILETAASGGDLNNGGWKVTTPFGRITDKQHCTYYFKLWPIPDDMTPCQKITSTDYYVNL